MPEWLKGADCKSVGLRLRWFESNPLHHRFHSLPARVGSFPRPVSPGCAAFTRFLQPSLTHGPMPEQGIPPLGMFASRRSPSRHRHASGCSSMVEQKPSKLMTRVRFPSPAPVSELVSLLEPACVLPARSDRDRLALLADFPDLIIIPDALRPWGGEGRT